MNLPPIALGLFTAVCLLGSSLAHASSASLAVKGSVAPVACTIAFSEGGAVNFGAITVAANDDYTLLPAQNLTLAIDCPNPTLLAIRVYPRATATIADDLAGQLNTTPRWVTPLTHDGRAVGGYTLRFDTATQIGDGDRVTPLSRNATAVVWGINNDLPLTSVSGGLRQLAWGPTTQAAAYVNIRSALTLQAVLERRSQLPAPGQDLALAGHSTFLLEYL